MERIAASTQERCRHVWALLGLTAARRRHRNRWDTVLSLGLLAILQCWAVVLVTRFLPWRGDVYAPEVLAGHGVQSAVGTWVPAGAVDLQPILLTFVVLCAVISFFLTVGRRWETEYDLRFLRLMPIDGWAPATAELLHQVREVTLLVGPCALYAALRYAVFAGVQIASIHIRGMRPILMIVTVTQSILMTTLLLVFSVALGYGAGSAVDMLLDTLLRRRSDRRFPDPALLLFMALVAVVLLLSGPLARVLSEFGLGPDASIRYLPVIGTVFLRGMIAAARVSARLGEAGKSLAIGTLLTLASVGVAVFIAQVAFGAALAIPREGRRSRKTAKSDRKRTTVLGRLPAMMHKDVVVVLRGGGTAREITGLFYMIAFTLVLGSFYRQAPSDFLGVRFTWPIVATVTGTLVPFYSALLFRYSSAAEGPAFQLLRTVPMPLTQLLWEKYLSCLSLGEVMTATVSMMAVILFGHAPNTATGAAVVLWCMAMCAAGLVVDMAAQLFVQRIDDQGAIVWHEYRFAGLLGLLPVVLCLFGVELLGSWISGRGASALLVAACVLIAASLCIARWVCAPLLARTWLREQA